MRRALVPAAVVVLAGPFVAGYFLSRPDRAIQPVAIATPLTQVREALAARYYRPISTHVLALGSVGAMLTALRDPYTAYLTPLSYRLVRHDTAASYSGIGVEVLPTAKGLVVIAVDHGPAARAGVEKGDSIVSASGRSTLGLDAANALARVDGRATRLRLVLERGGKRIAIDVQRGVVSAPTVEGRMLRYAGAPWGDIRLATFRAGATGLVAQQVRRLQHLGADGIVLDVRGDPGGLLSEAIGVSSLFLHRGVVVVSLSGAHYVHEVFRAHGGAVTGLPLVILVDRYTASSAEIVSAALSEHGRATVVGERTFGKGVVQAVDPLDNGAALILTVARYFTPDGRQIAHVGVVPQVLAADDPATPADEGLLAALRTLARPAS